MFISRVKSKGNYYIYLYGYHNKNGVPKIKTLYGFGNIERALSSMKAWKEDFNSFPKELIDLGCTKEDLREWLKILKTGVTKTGKKSKMII